MKTRFKASIAVILLLLAFLAGHYTKPKSVDYDKLKSEYERTIHKLDSQLESSENRRNSFSYALDSLDSVNKVLYNRLGKTTVVYRELIKSMTSKELEALMIKEYNQ